MYLVVDKKEIEHIYLNAEELSDGRVVVGIGVLKVLSTPIKNAEIIDEAGYQKLKYTQKNK